MNINKYLSAGGIPYTHAPEGIKVFSGNQEMLTLLQVAEEACNNISQILETLYHHISLLNTSDRDASVSSDFVAQYLRRIDQIADKTVFRNIGLLNGKSGITGEVSDKRLAFIRCGENTPAEKDKLIPVKVQTGATRSYCRTDNPLNDSIIKSEKNLYIRAGSKYFNYDLSDITTVEQFLTGFRYFLLFTGLDLGAGIDEDGRLTVYHKQPGSQNKFALLSAVTKMFTNGKRDFCEAVSGRDIRATVGNTEATGIGNFMIAYSQENYADGLVLSFNGMLNEEDETVGYIRLRDQSWANKTKDGTYNRLSIPSMRPVDLGKGIFNESGFTDLSRIQVINPVQQADALRMIIWVKEDISHYTDSIAHKKEAVSELALKEAMEVSMGYLPEHMRITRPSEADVAIRQVAGRSAAAGAVPGGGNSVRFFA